jgi:hypothetical protein
VLIVVAYHHSTASYAYAGCSKNKPFHKFNASSMQTVQNCEFSGSYVKYALPTYLPNTETRNPDGIPAKS